jgi:hypothetical protein
MKPISIAFKVFTIIALAALAVGCASNRNLLNKENAAVGAGFRIITPKTAEHLAMLQKLPADKITRIHYHGKIYYVLPDKANNQAYVGGPKQYKAYVQFRQEQQRNLNHYEAEGEPIEVVEVNSMDWGGWSGWAAVGGVDDLRAPGWY